MTPLTQNFRDLYTGLMKTNFMKAAVPAFGRKPAFQKVNGMVSKSAPLLPAVFQPAYVKPLEAHLQSLFARMDMTNAQDVSFLETLTACVYEHGIKAESAQLHRFLAVISDLYVSFLDKSKRVHLNIPLEEVLPPLAVLQSSPDSGPFTVPVDQTSSMLGATVGVVSFPATFGNHPLFYGSLAHETGGHDVIHADAKLMPQLRAGVYDLFKGAAGRIVRPVVGLLDGRGGGGCLWPAQRGADLRREPGGVAGGVHRATRKTASARTAVAHAVGPGWRRCRWTCIPRIYCDWRWRRERSPPSTDWACRREAGISPNWTSLPRCWLPTRPPWNWSATPW